MKYFLYNVILWFSGINGLLSLKDIANRKGWKIMANEHFDPVSDFNTLDVSPQLEAIRKTRTRIIVLNTMARYTVVILTQASQKRMLKDWVWIVTDGSTNTVHKYSAFRVSMHFLLEGTKSHKSSFFKLCFHTALNGELKHMICKLV